MTLTNPVGPWSMADPFLLKHNGSYYAFGTGPAPDGRIFPVLYSPDLEHWEPLGGAMLPLADSGAQHYWAPEVIYHQGIFYLYYAVVAFGMDHHIRVATSEHPAGPYRDTGVNLTGHLHDWAIDPHCFRDDDGLLYLFYTVEMEHGGRMGVGNVVDRLLQPLSLEGKPSLVTPPCAEWQEYMRARPEKGGVDWFTVEGPCVVRRGRTYYQMYSGGNYNRANYGVGYATSERVRGPWRQWVPPGEAEPGRILKTKSPRLFGPGHHSVAPGPNNVDLYCCYHAWQPDRKGRRMCLDRLEFHGDRLVIAGPTEGVQPGPRRPWFFLPGPVQVDGLHSLPQALPREVLLEVNLRALTAQRQGVVLAPGVTVVLDYQRGTIAAGEWEAALPSGFRPEVYHQLLVQVGESEVTVRLDGLPVGQWAWTPPEPGPWGLLSEGGSGEFAGVTATAHFSRVGPIRLEGEQVLLWGDPLPTYDLEVDLQLSGPEAVAGCCAWMGPNGRQALVLLTPRDRRWYLATAVQEGGRTEWQYDPLPVDWDWQAVHHLRLCREADALAVFLDGEFLCWRELPAVPGRAGVVTRAGEASFTWFRRTGFSVVSRKAEGDSALETGGA